MPWLVLTDEPDDFKGLPVRAIRYAPTGPMAIDYLARLRTTQTFTGYQRFVTGARVIQ